MILRPIMVAPKHPDAQLHTIHNHFFFSVCSTRLCTHAVYADRRTRVSAHTHFGCKECIDAKNYNNNTQRQQQKHHKPDKNNIISNELMLEYGEPYMV